MLKITHPITGAEVQVAQNDFPEKMNWEEASRACNALGSGWRLPTKEELEAMYEQLHEKGQGNFNSGSFWNREAFYWSGTEFDGNLAWFFHFYYRGANSRGKRDAGYVRAVRAF